MNERQFNQRVIPLQAVPMRMAAISELSDAERRAAESVLAMAEQQLESTKRIILRLRAKLGLPIEGFDK